jgi:hypothetical protein
VKSSALSQAQKKAAERGMAEALKRLGINAAEFPVKAAPAAVEEAPFEWWWLLLAAAVIAGVVICVADVCRSHGQQFHSPSGSNG